MKKRPIVLIQGPLIEKVKKDAHVRLVQIAKRNIEQGKYKPSMTI